MCMFKDGYYYRLNSNLDGLLPDTFIVGIARPEWLTGEENEALYNVGSYQSPSYPDSRLYMHDYIHILRSPAGIVNDGFKLTALEVYPKDGPANSKCHLRFDGSFVHEDTLRVSARFYGCTPFDSIIPLASKVYPSLEFIRIKL
jgi:hypothetical protein